MISSRSAYRAPAFAKRHPVALGMRLVERQALLALGDGITGAVGAVLAYTLWRLVVHAQLHIGSVGVAFFAASWVVSLTLVHGYSALVPRSRLYSAAAVAKATTIMIVLCVVAFFTQPYRINRPTIVIAVGLGTMLIVVFRATLARVLLNDAFATPAILVCAAPLDADVTRALESARFEYQIVATQLLDGSHSDSVVVNELRRHLEAGRFREVLFDASGAPSAATVIEACVVEGIPVRRLSTMAEQYLSRISIHHVEPEWLLSLPMGRLLDRPVLAARRALDLLLATIVTVPLFLLTPFLVALIRWDSPGPAYFRQRRVGQHGRDFTLYKFRTMHAGAEAGVARWSGSGDTRVTRVGRWLRRTRLDEWPQVMNVWRNEMSFIGPRPERPEFVRELAAQIPHYRTRLMVKPGLTGWAQVKSEYASSVEDSVRKLEYDMYYVKNRSVRLDLQIVILTIFVVLGLRGR